MTEEILFEVTKDKLETGLRGVPVGYCTTSYVDPQKGLFYIDRPVSSLTQWSSLQAIYLLYAGREGSEAELKQFARQLESRACCSEALVRAVEGLPREGHPMKLFCAAILLLGMLESKGDYREDTLHLIAKLPHLVALVINHHGGWGKTPHPEPQKGYVESFVQMLCFPQPANAQLGAVFNLFHLLHLDHGGGNLSTFVGKAVASGLEDLYGSIASAMCALAGPRHGKANQDSLAFVHSLLAELGSHFTEASLESALRRRVDNKEVIFGFGHAVLRVEDPRATVQYAFLEQHYSHHPLTRLVLMLRTVGTRVLKENPKIADPYPNVDAVSGTLLSVAGFAYPEYYTVLFGFSRCVGIALQIVYERCEARGGKGTPIVRPKYLFQKR